MWSGFQINRNYLQLLLAAPKWGYSVTEMDHHLMNQNHPSDHLTPDSLYNCVLSLHQDQPYLHSSHVPRNGDRGSSDEACCDAQISLSHSYPLNNLLYSIHYASAGSISTCEYDQHKRWPLLSLYLCNHKDDGGLSLCPYEACHKLLCVDISESTLHDTCIPKLYELTYCPFRNSFCLDSET